MNVEMVTISSMASLSVVSGQSSVVSGQWLVVSSPLSVCVSEFHNR